MLYLGRYASSEANLARVLRDRVRRHVERHGGDAAQARSWIPPLVERLARAGLVDDRSSGEGLIRRLRRRGASERQIRAKLAEKGIRRELAEELLAPDEDSDPAAIELAGACRTVRRRGFGPYHRDPERRRERRERELASLARAGYALGAAARALDAPDREQIEDWILAGSPLD